MFERVLVPLDGSLLSERALAYGAILAERLGVRLTLLRAFDGPRRTLTLLAGTRTAPITVGMTTPAMVGAVTEAAAETEAASRAYLTVHAGDLEAGGVTVELLVVDGEPAEAILQEAEREPGTVVVMSTHGRGGLGRLLFGSTTQDVLRRSHVPLMVIRAQEGSTAPEAPERS